MRRWRVAAKSPGRRRCYFMHSTRLVHQAPAASVCASNASEAGHQRRSSNPPG
jgi:hypothetical protein